MDARELVRRLELDFRALDLKLLWKMTGADDRPFARIKLRKKYRPA